MLRVGREVGVEASEKGDGEGTLIPIEPAAKVLQLTHWGVRYRVKRGLLKPIRWRRKLFFDVGELLRTVKAKKGK
jgi:hypothetical protein